jgi:hypothetical protein
MGGTEVELHYFRKDVIMNKGSDIKNDLIEEIGKKHHINMGIKEKAPGGYAELIINMTAEDEVGLREAIKEIIMLYGKPDLPMSLFGGEGKKRGKELAKSVMQELSL